MQKALHFCKASAPSQFTFSNQLQMDLEQLIELEAYILDKEKG